jgi:hypothetical protein
MGPSTRLSFRCWLKGGDLRVQIFSLTNGYHRHLLLHDLPQQQWLDPTVDMTQARRPDGSGGPLAANERIDDIQFYTHPHAELIIDDVVLYDAAPDRESEPFPKKLIFTGWFDSGRQGQEWPGDFEIIDLRKPYHRAARSLANEATGMPWLRVSLRGERLTGDLTRLRFRYHLAGADSMKVVLVGTASRSAATVELKDLQKETWTTTTVDFTAAGTRFKSGDKVDEIRFLLPASATLLVDDLLLYEPGAAR